MVRVVVITLLVALQWPQAIAGMLAVCLCQEGVSLVGQEGGCHCKQAPDAPGHEACIPLVSDFHDCDDHLYSLFAGDSVQTPPALAPADQACLSQPLPQAAAMPGQTVAASDLPGRIRGSPVLGVVLRC